MVHTSMHPLLIGAWEGGLSLDPLPPIRRAVLRALVTTRLVWMRNYFAEECIPS